ncbi:nucleotidyltransferase domain-containing protein [Streptomyces griseorubiginosus]|uniref:nucleotidyltransferase domain-containing protein n=1 Tax=Streptomyces griseorubiginosus TaxID=67304 RepID=UPI0036436346
MHRSPVSIIDNDPGPDARVRHTVTASHDQEQVVEAGEVLRIPDLLRRARAEVLVGPGGGLTPWSASRVGHRDLDPMRRQEQKQAPAVVAAPAAAGHVESLDPRRVRFVVVAPGGREVKLHPLVFVVGDGSAVQASGVPERPFLFHQGDEPTERDRHDMAPARRVFGIVTNYLRRRPERRRRPRAGGTRGRRTTPP